MAFIFRSPAQSMDDLSKLRNGKRFKSFSNKSKPTKSVGTLRTSKTAWKPSEESEKFLQNQHPSLKRSGIVYISEENVQLSQWEQLENEIQFNILKCLICDDLISYHQKTWNCCNCHKIFHLECVTNFSINQVCSLQQWQCLACSTEMREIPLDYYCFCKKSVNPEGRNLPHSCGKKCGKIKECGHPCNLACHPGKCSRKCEFLASIYCHCGKERILSGCNTGKSNFSCNNTCGKVLKGCKTHECRKQCHPLDCQPCKKLHISQNKTFYSVLLAVFLVLALFFYLILNYERKDVLYLMKIVIEEVVFLLLEVYEFFRDLFRFLRVFNEFFAYGSILKGFVLRVFLRV